MSVTPWRPSSEIDREIPTLVSLPNGHDGEPPLWEGDGSSNGPLLEHAAERVGTSRANSPLSLESLTWADLLALPPKPPPMIPPGFPKVGLTVVAGPPKVGKTLATDQWALAAGRATLVMEEGSRDGISYRLRRQAEALGILEPDIVVIHRQRIRLDDRQSVARLRAHVAERRPAILVMDPLNRLHGADENRPTQMTPVMDALAAIAYDFECAVLTVHHLAKPSQERRGDLWDRFRGATSIRSGTDCNLVMDGSGAVVRLVGEYRDAEPLSTYLELDRETLTFSVTDGPKGGGKAGPDALLAFVTERNQVTARDVMLRFDIKSKVTALAALDNHPALDSFEGVRGQRTYYVTVQ